MSKETQTGQISKNPLESLNSSSACLHCDVGIFLSISFVLFYPFSFFLSFFPLHVSHVSRLLLMLSFARTRSKIFFTAGAAKMLLQRHCTGLGMDSDGYALRMFLIKPALQGPSADSPNLGPSADFPTLGTFSRFSHHRGPQQALHHMNLQQTNPLQGPSTHSPS